MDYELIEKYCKNQLSDNEKILFEKELAGDNDLKNEVELYRNTILEFEQIVKNKENEHELKSTLESIGENYFDNNPKTIPLKNYFLIVGSIAAMLVVAFFIFTPQPTLYEQYAQIEPITEQVKGENNTLFFDAIQAYNSKNYEKAIELFPQYLNSFPEDVSIQLALAISYTETDNYTAALTIYDSKTVQNSILKNEADWYKALTYLKQKDYEKCKVVLNSIPQKSDYFKQAQHLLLEL